VRISDGARRRGAFLMAGEVLPPSESDGLGGASLVSSSGYNSEFYF
jgi:hypothetical protein